MRILSHPLLHNGREKTTKEKKWKRKIKEKDKDVICDILMQENTDQQNASGKMKHKLFKNK